MAANYREQQLALSVYQEALVVVLGGYGFGHVWSLEGSWLSLCLLAVPLATTKAA